MTDQKTLPDSLWVATAKPAPATDQLQGEHYYDVAIIGAGFTGLRSALVLAQHGVKVAVLDAGDIGYGGSGRNGGQVNPIGHEPPATIAKRWDKKWQGDYASRFVEMTIQSADELFNLIREHNIDCDAEQNGWIRGIHGDSARPEFEAMYEGWKNAGADMRLLNTPEIQQLSGSQSYQFGWLASRAGSVQPMSYVRGLAAAALNAGATIFTQSPVLNLQSVTKGWKLKSSKGSVLAEKVIVGTNGYTDKLIPGLQESFVPVVSLQAATKPLTEEQDATILPQRQTFADTRRVIFYFRKTMDNRLVFGSAGTSGETPDHTEKHRIEQGLKTVYAQFNNLELDYLWGGQIAVTQDHLPHIHQPLPGVIAGLGCNGRGVAMSTVMGRLLAETVLGKDVKDLPIPVVPIKAYPFHRFHRVGIKLAVAWKEFQDRRESNTRL